MSAADRRQVRSAASLGLLQRTFRRHLRAADPRSDPPLPTEDTGSDATGYLTADQATAWFASMKRLSHGNVKAPIIRRGRPMLFRIVAVPEFGGPVGGGQRVELPAEQAHRAAGQTAEQDCAGSPACQSRQQAFEPDTAGIGGKAGKVAPGAREQRRGIAQVQRGKQLLIWKQRGAGHPDRPAIIDYIHFMLTLRTASQQHSRSLPLDDFDGGPSRIPWGDYAACRNGCRAQR